MSRNRWDLGTYSGLMHKGGGYAGLYLRSVPELTASLFLATPS